MNSVSNYICLFILKFCLFSTALSISAFSAVVEFSIGGAIGGPIDIGASGITAQTFVVSTGTGSPASVHGETGLAAPNLGGTYDGNFFNSTDLAVTPELMTRLSTPDRRTIDNGFGNSSQDSIGFHIKFSGAVSDFSFGAVDIDGVQGINNEWIGAFGFNSNDLVFANVTNNPASSELGIVSSAVNGSGSWQTTVDSALGINATRDAVPLSLSLAINQSNVNDRDPDDAISQARFDFNDDVTDVFILFGSRAVTDQSAAAIQNSGLTGASVNVIPEPSSALLILFGLVSLGARRKRS